ncbi:MULTISPECIES: hypothetical protein [Burkholderia]|uniref:hypothetical protein n=1 Tax=Burkholderia TaxID=32008 RepID=UPI0011AF5CAC|nr:MULTISPECIES: hypothetical protein [unclassified Burkholderia]
MKTPKATINPGPPQKFPTFVAQTEHIRSASCANPVQQRAAMQWVRAILSGSDRGIIRKNGRLAPYPAAGIRDADGWHSVGIQW